MAYDPTREYAELLSSTVRGSLNFSGRSRRTEFILYYIVQSLIGGPIGSVLPFSAGHESFGALRIVISIIFYAPLPALFARRLHDQGRSAWWAALLLVPVAIGWISSSAGGQLPSLLLQSIGLISVVVIIALALWEGTEGDNAYGPNPRFSE